VCWSWIWIFQDVSHDLKREFNQGGYPVLLLNS